MSTPKIAAKQRYSEGWNGPCLVADGVLRRSQVSEGSRGRAAVFRTRADPCAFMTRGGPQRILQLLAQPSVCAEQPQPHGHYRYSQAAGNFLRRIVQHISQQASLPPIVSSLWPLC